MLECHCSMVSLMNDRRLSRTLFTPWTVHRVFAGCCPRGGILGCDDHERIVVSTCHDALLLSQLYDDSVDCRGQSKGQTAVQCSVAAVLRRISKALRV